MTGEGVGMRWYAFPQLSVPAIRSLEMSGKLKEGRQGEEP